jgi:hypothetical protein
VLASDASGTPDSTVRAANDNSSSMRAAAIGTRLERTFGATGCAS